MCYGQVDVSQVAWNSPRVAGALTCWPLPECQVTGSITLLVLMLWLLLHWARRGVTWTFGGSLETSFSQTG